MTEAQREHFIGIMQVRYGKGETKRFIKAVDKRFPLENVLEYRKCSVVIVREGDQVNIYSWSGDSGNWYQLEV